MCYEVKCRVTQYRAVLRTPTCCKNRATLCTAHCVDLHRYAWIHSGLLEPVERQAQQSASSLATLAILASSLVTLAIPASS